MSNLSGLYTPDYLLSNHNMLIGVNTVSIPDDDEEQTLYDIRHLVRVKKICIGDMEYQEELDLNCDGIIDEADEVLMKKLLLNTIKLSDLPIYQNLNLIVE